MNQRRRDFETNGFLVLPGFCSKDQCAMLMDRAAALAKSYDHEQHRSIFQTSEQSRTSDDYFLASGDNISFFFEKDAMDSQGNLLLEPENAFNKIGHALHDLDPVFESFSHSSELQSLASDLGMPDHVIIQSMFIFKHAKIGGVVDVHQDSSFLYTSPDSCTGYWFALEDATVSNGCLWAAAGGHCTTLRERFHRQGTGTCMDKLDATPISLDDMQPLEVAQGTCIVLHGLLPHYSKPNHSGKSRQAYALHCIDPRATYATDNWLQRPDLRLRGFS